MRIEWDPKTIYHPRIDTQFGDKFMMIKRDVTHLTKSRMRIIARRQLTEAEKNTYDKISWDDRHKSLAKEFAERLADDFPSGGEWTVTNAVQSRVYDIEHENKPSDVGYSIVFVRCPWDLFVRYWNKPIRLKSKLTYRRNYKKGLPRKTSNKNIEILSFVQDINDWSRGTKPQLKFLSNQILMSDFSFAFSKRRRNAVDQKIANWMMENAPTFKLLTDEKTPFCDPTAEFCFTSDIFGKYHEEPED